MTRPAPPVDRNRQPLRLALVGDYDPSVTAHRAIPIAVELAAAAERVRVEPRWVPTAGIDPASPIPDDVDGVWCVPNSPYASTEGALAAIRAARERAIPFLGTCGGFQHAVLEIARNLWGRAEAAHAELEPGAPDPVIAPLACSLVEATGGIRLAPGSRLALAYGGVETVEGYHCRYGFNAGYLPFLDAGPLRAVGWDLEGDVRVVELDGHPFFVATLFQPERAALGGVVPPVVRAFLDAIAARVDPLAAPGRAERDLRAGSLRSSAAPT